MQQLRYPTSCVGPRGDEVVVEIKRMQIISRRKAKALPQWPWSPGRHRNQRHGGVSEQAGVSVGCLASVGGGAGGGGGLNTYHRRGNKSYGPHHLRVWTCALYGVVVIIRSVSTACQHMLEPWWVVGPAGVHTLSSMAASLSNPPHAHPRVRPPPPAALSKMC